MGLFFDSSIWMSNTWGREFFSLSTYPNPFACDNAKCKVDAKWTLLINNSLVTKCVNIITFFYIDDLIMYQYAW